MFTMSLSCSPLYSCFSFSSCPPLIYPPFLLPFFILPLSLTALQGCTQSGAPCYRQKLSTRLSGTGPGTICRGVKTGPDLLRGASELLTRKGGTRYTPSVSLFGPARKPAWTADKERLSSPGVGWGDQSRRGPKSSEEERK